MELLRKVAFNLLSGQDYRDIEGRPHSSIDGIAGNNPLNKELRSYGMSYWWNRAWPNQPEEYRLWDFRENVDAMGFQTLSALAWEAIDRITREGRHRE